LCGLSSTLLINEPYDQAAPDVDGNLVAYLDSQAAQTYYIAAQNEVRVFDRDTQEKRVVLPPGEYYGLGIWGHWVAVNNLGTWGDSLILCDLQEMGLVDGNNHAIPEGAVLDGGVDGGPDGGFDGEKK